MRLNRLTATGMALMLAGLAVFGTMFGYTIQTASAGDPTPEFTPTCVRGQTCVTATSTIVRVKTHTPTTTSTAAATNTPAPTNTAVPATPTKTGGNEGAAVRPPNTGTGGGSSGSGSMWVIGLGALLVAGGAGSVAYGVRRR